MPQVLIPEEVETELRKKCPKCGSFFSTKGGGITRHMAKCQGDPIAATNEEAAANETIDPLDASKPLNSTLVDTKELICPHCNKQYAAKHKRHYESHLLNCQAGPPTQLSQSLPTDASKSIFDMKKSEVFFKRDIFTFLFPLVQNTISPVATETGGGSGSTDMSVYENMYKRNEWNCFMCDKW